MKKQRKAQISWIVVLVLFLAVLLVVMLLVFKIKGVTKKGIEKSVCRLSVEKLAAGKAIPVIGPVVGEKVTGGKIECPREKLEFKKDESSDEKSKKLVKAIEKCLWNFGEGKIDFAQGGVLLSEVNCAICTKISFEKGASFDLSSYYEWIKNNMINFDTTYYDYFKKLNKRFEELKIRISTIDLYIPVYIPVFDASKEYYLFFSVIPEPLAGKALAPAFKAILGEEETRQYADFRIRPVDEALKNCDHLLN